MKRVVQKFGGTSVGNLERIQATADIVERSVQQGIETAVVVSAMSGETNRLIGLANALCPDADVREMDQLVSTGEQVSAALLAIELQKRGVMAHSYTGVQAGFRTDSSYSRARILSVECERMLHRIERGEVPILTGFQGVNEHGDVTTLGRGGSDTSAVALAIALNADMCDIFTDVDGVYTTDPRIVPQAAKIERISYEEMLELASQGAKVLQNRSVELAMRYQMPIHLRSSFVDVPGTMVMKEDEVMERAAITGVAYNRDEAKITIKGIPDHPGIASALFGPIAEAGLNVDVIVQNVSEDGTTDITFTVPRGDFRKAMKIVQGVSKDMQARDVKGDDHVAKVSIIGVGMRSHSGVARKMFETLAEKAINIQMITTSEIKITVVIEEQHVDAAVKSLHTAFGLDAEGAAA
ncbi:MAG: aspartate kinase [Zetaproteobacteria bacterium CG12_big_fil_rev_8_21_14_0_65_55_1124]|nr:MAG: aspartate kinase [Zetaproteobacteria bacterium CG1_02_55_237]PIS18449.1 MAG: aspartate kinase [Zetaproteobacteria bacterium CG08_land_8_20_14_0_20_55_17]PIW42207.1 MAG: aspartate kinase [Zetaproteobacteria bacterium CG12_big_fil_rev_8_21_14_0_65_55_1124]PIY53776.1 MAG: aspartate kinase [Zetaproteobacteria bacterium CG_4_10_14_0_8_um_filter_55_43]PIZ38469.1 MAG: aspartate kinase [Zetaproteobacteria bacterium CG_4_10_14_0_2_um_filter_55_20]PJB80810.1 MAG: aspartate kinase [Zetaproteobact